MGVWPETMNGITGAIGDAARIDSVRCMVPGVGTTAGLGRSKPEGCLDLERVETAGGCVSGSRATDGLGTAFWETEGAQRDSPAPFHPGCGFANDWLAPPGL